MSQPPPDGTAPPTGSERDFEGIGAAEGSPAIPAAAVASRAAAAPEAIGRASDREIWALAWPVILSQVLASAVSLVDIAMLGRLGKEAIAAVGYATQYLWLAQSVLFAIGVACVALMARAVGAGRPERARHALAACLGVAVGLGAVFSLVCALWPRTLLALLDAEPRIIAVGARYFQLTLGSTLLLSVTITLESAFRALKNTRTPMLIALAITLVKTALNYALIFGALGAPRLGLVGAGIATLVAQAVGLALFALAGRRSGGDVPVRASLSDLIAARPIYREVVQISLPAIGERFVMNVAMMSYFALAGSYGSAALAAYTIGVRLLSFSWIPGIGFSVAAATLVGQSLGNSDPAGASRAGWRSIRFALLTSIGLGLVYAVLRTPLSRAFTDDASVIDALGPFMLVLALAQPLLGLHFTLAGALRGSGDTLTPLAAATIGNWLFRVPLAYLASRVLELPVLWLWLALVCDHLARAAWLGLEFRRGRWQRRLGVRSGSPG